MNTDEIQVASAIIQLARQHNGKLRTFKEVEQNVHRTLRDKIDNPHFHLNRVLSELEKLGLIERSFNGKGLPDNVSITSAGNSIEDFEQWYRDHRQDQIRGRKVVTWKYQAARFWWVPSLFALISFIISVRSCQIAEDAYELNKTKYNNPSLSNDSISE